MLRSPRPGVSARGSPSTRIEETSCWSTSREAAKSAAASRVRCSSGTFAAVPQAASPSPAAAATAIPNHARFRYAGDDNTLIMQASPHYCRLPEPPTPNGEPRGCAARKDASTAGHATGAARGGAADGAGRRPPVDSAGFAADGSQFRLNRPVLSSHAPSRPPPGRPSQRRRRATAASMCPDGTRRRVPLSTAVRTAAGEMAMATRRARLVLLPRRRRGGARVTAGSRECPRRSRRRGTRGTSTHPCCRCACSLPGGRCRLPGRLR